MRFGALIWLLGFSSLLVGCSSDSAQPEAQPPPRPAAVISDARISIWSAGDSPAEIQRLQNEREFVVQGTFRAADGKDYDGKTVVLSVVGTGSDGKPVTQDSAIAKAQRVAGNEYEFRGTLDTPKREGEFSVRARLRDQTIAESNLTVGQ